MLYIVVISISPWYDETRFYFLYMKYHKLVRDNIPALIERNGAKVVTHIAEDKEYEEKLIKKLDEEVIEYNSDRTIEELADILEVIYAIGEYQGVTKETLEEMRLKKREARGGFEKRIILDETKE